jgi:hypothetical protein
MRTVLLAILILICGLTAFGAQAPREDDPRSGWPPDDRPRDERRIERPAERYLDRYADRWADERPREVAPRVAGPRDSRPREDRYREDRPRDERYRAEPAGEARRADWREPEPLREAPRDRRAVRTERASLPPEPDPLPAPRPVEPGGEYRPPVMQPTDIMVSLGLPCCHFVADCSCYFLQPVWKTNPAYLVTHNFTTLRQEDFNYSWSLNPVVQVGFVGEHVVGVRARYWRFDENARESFLNDGSVVLESASPLGLVVGSGAPREGMIFNSHVKLEVIDLEATRVFQSNDWSILLTAGARYAHLGQEYNAFSANTGTLREALLSGHRFKGGGPTASIETWYPIGHGGWAVFANTRAAILFGQAKHRATRFIALNQDSPYDDAGTDSNDLIPVLEMLVGLEYAACLGSCQLVFQVGGIGQVWFGAGNPANSQFLFTGSSDASANLGFVGLSATVGFHF